MPNTDVKIVATYELIPVDPVIQEPSKEKIVDSVIEEQKENKIVKKILIIHKLVIK